MRLLHTTALWTSAGLIGLVFSLITPIPVTAQQYTLPTIPELDFAATEAWTTERWLTEPHPQPQYFSVSPQGEFAGYTTSGHYFSQVLVPNDYQIPVYRFSIDAHSHLIVDGVIIYSLTELSIRLTILAETQHAIG